jgi:hypothetical protein
MRENELETPEIKQDDFQRESTPWWFVLGSIIVALSAAYYAYRFWGGLGPGVLPQG